MTDFDRKKSIGCLLNKMNNKYIQKCQFAAPYASISLLLGFDKISH